MKYCSECGAHNVWLIPADDNRPRFVCTSCDTIHYQNPRMVVGAIAEADDKILFCRRSIEPCRGKWTLPAGYLENGETVAEGAKRESLEEALAELDDLKPYCLVNIPHINQIYLMFRARLVNADFRAGNESEEVVLFTPEEIPWENLAFPSIYKVLTRYCQDLKSGQFSFNIQNVTPQRGRLKG